MRKSLPALLAVLCLLTPVYAQSPRLDLLLGHGRAEAPEPEKAGFRVAVGGQVVLHVIPMSGDKARLIGADGRERTVALPPLTPAPVETPAEPAKISPANPEFVTRDFSTLTDGLTLLLGDAVSAAPGSFARFSAWLRLSNEPGRLAHSRVEVAGRGARWPDPELDRLVERFLSANPLPPLIGGSGLCELIVVATGGPRPVLSVWIGKPFAEAAVAPASLAGGWLWQEPLRLPAAVEKSETAAGLRLAYERERQAARARLVAVLAEAPTWPFFGWWHWSNRETCRWAERELAAAPAGGATESLFLGAHALAREKRVPEAVRWIEQAAAVSGDPEVKAQANLLARNWRRRLPGLFAPPPVAADAAYRWELLAQPSRPAEADDPRRALAEDLVLLGLLGNENPQRADRDLLWRALAGQAAGDLAAALDGESSLIRLMQLSAWLAADEPANAALLFDAGAILYATGRQAAAADVYRGLLADFPLSPVAPEAGLRLFAALEAAGEIDRAEAVAWQLVGDLAPGSAWHQARRDQESDTVPSLAGRTKPAAAVREWLLGRLRDGAFFTFFQNRDPQTLAAAERAARLRLDTIDNSPTRRADWLTLGKILAAAGKTDEAATAYAHVSLDEIDDPPRLEALQALAGVVNPDVRRLADALGDDPWVGWLAAILN